MADYNINAITRRRVFTGSAGVGPYAFTFEILDQDDLAVYFNETKLTITTDFSVTINANGTGSVTLVVNVGGNVPQTPVGSDQIIVVGARDIERVTDFVTAGDLLASSLNEQLDALTIFDQQLAEEGQRSMRAPVYDPALVADGGTLDMTLPAKADRVDAVLAFDTDGNPIKGPTVSGITTITALASDITALADIEDGTVATDAISNTATVVSDIPTVAGVASDVTTVAGISSDVTTVAANLSGITAFAAVYSSGPTDPTTGLNEGDLFFNTTSDKFKIYNGSSWRDASVLDFYSETAFNAPSNPNSLSLGFGAGPFTSKGIALGGSDATVKISGAYTLPKTDGTNGQVLTTDGSGAVSFDDVSTAGALPLAGGTMTGDLTLSGTTKAIFGTDDLEIFNQGAPGYVNKITSTNGNNIILDTTGNVYIKGATARFQGPTGDNGIIFTDGGSVSVSHNGVQKLNTEASGINIDGNLTLTGTVDGADIAQNIPASLGTAGQVLTVNSGATATEWASSGSGDLLAANNLSDVSDASTSRTNLGVAIGSDVQAHSSVLDGTTASFTTAKDSKLTGIEAGATADQTGAEIKTAYEAEANAFTDAQFTKLAGIEASADVTDTANVTAAGALMDSEVTNLAQVKAFNSADYATAAQGATADAALPRTGGAMTGAITTNSTFDGRDVSVDGAKLDGIAAGATAYGDSDVDTHLNTSTASASEVLSWTGTDYDWVAVAAGGDPDLYRDNAVGATTPSATGTNSVAINNLSQASGTNSIALGSASISSATSSTAFTNSNASGSNSIAGAIGNNSTGYGARNTGAVAFGYTANSSGSHAISIGYQATAAGNYATCIGRGGSTTAEGASSLGGRSGLATGIYSTTVGGESNKAYADYAVAMGYWTYADKIGQNAFASGRFNDDGDAQTSKFVLRSDTTDATPEALTTNNSTASTNNQIILGNNSAYSFSGTIIARQDATDGSNYASWEIKGALLRDANAASTVLGNGIQNKLYATAGASAWAIALTADTTNGGLAITVTGAAATNIKWVAAVNTSEVIYN